MLWITRKTCSAHVAKSIQSATDHCAGQLGPAARLCKHMNDLAAMKGSALKVRGLLKRHHGKFHTRAGNRPQNEPLAEIIAAAL